MPDKHTPPNAASSPCIWLLSAYRSASHAAWADWLVDSFKHIRWQRLELPGRHFRWRIRGNPLSWLDQLPEETPALILATSMVDLATLKGLHPRLAAVPAIYYFHENQFAYPVGEQQHDSVDPQMVQLYGALAADQLLFNSSFNRDSFFNGIDELLQKLPDQTPHNLLPRLEAKSAILPVPIRSLANANAHKNPQLVVWNHRWEYDKNPQLFADALLQLKKKNQPFQLALLGERANRKPAALFQIEQQLASHIVFNGRASRDDYQHYLQQAAIVVSTAIHEFQGLAILEAVSAGAAPLVPDDLCYREQYPAMFRYPPRDSQALADKLLQMLQQTPAAPDVSAWYEENLVDYWRQYLTPAD
ncbi:MAG TPA: DUF3524 domain-containing protein [Gammaproteobacteria bacterium]